MALKWCLNSKAALHQPLLRRGMPAAVYRQDWLPATMMCPLI